VNSSLLHQAIELYQQRQADKAAAICRNVLQTQPNQPDALHILGNIAKDQGQTQQAMQYFQRGLQAAPGHIHLLNSAGLLFRNMGYTHEAQQCFQRAIEIDPTYMQGRYNLANLCRAQGDIDRARELYRQVLKQNSQFPDALANLSSILEEEHQLDEAEALARKAVDIDPTNFMALVTLANLAMRRRDYEEVLQHLGPLLENDQLSPVNYTVAVGLIAQAKQGLGDYARAFEFYQRANEAFFEMYAGPMKGLRSMYAPESLKILRDYFSNAPSAAHSPAPDDGRAPVFLLGFPRSGTTLLDQILSSHSRITVLEEKENLEDFYRQFPAIPEKLVELMSCPEGQLNKWRDNYWQKIESEVELSVDTMVVDKLPLNTILLPHIRKLFPAAKIVFALRDPRDVVLSCFQQRFGMNQAMFQFLKLETAVSYYDQVMSLARVYIDQLSIPVHLIRYESVIADFDEQVRGVLTFLGLPWEDSVKNYRVVARQRRISTPSARDVTRPLYSTSIGKWRRYSESIEGRFEPLQKWVDYWGYESHEPESAHSNGG
jgi:tetratricopeptide (TPR) repeat protein